VIFRGSYIAGDNYVLQAGISFTHRGVDLPRKPALEQLHEDFFTHDPALAGRPAPEALSVKTGEVRLWRRHHASTVVQWPAAANPIQWADVTQAYRHTLCELEFAGIVAQSIDALFPPGSAGEVAILNIINSCNPAGLGALPLAIKPGGLYPWDPPAQAAGQDGDDYFDDMDRALDDFSNWRDANGMMVAQIGMRIAQELRETREPGTVVWELDWSAPFPVDYGVRGVWLEQVDGFYCEAEPSGVVLMDNKVVAQEQHGFLYAHEMAHCRYLWHHETKTWKRLRRLLRMGRYDNRRHHDLNDHNCTMCYPSGITSRIGLTWDQGALTQPRFCGKCTLKLRGWRISDGLPRES
jgi:hypothetical protein